MKGPPLPIGVYGHAMINLGNEKIILIGGLTGSNLSQTLKQTFVYNHNHSVWSSGPALNQARFYHAVGIVTDEATQEKFVFVAGGTKGSGMNLNSTEILINQTFSFGKTHEAIQGLDFFSAQVWYKNAKRIHIKALIISPGFHFYGI